MASARMNAAEIVEVLVAVRELVARPENDFSWSSWGDQGPALAELDELIDLVRRERIPRRTLDVLFAPTGPIQEVSISSGWGAEFLAIAERYDRAIEGKKRP